MKPAARPVRCRPGDGTEFLFFAAVLARRGRKKKKDAREQSGYKNSFFLARGNVNLSDALAGDRKSRRDVGGTHRSVGHNKTRDKEKRTAAAA